MKTAIIAAVIVAGSVVFGSNERTTEFNWRDITPTKNLIYHDCFDKFQCARLDVPMDYNRTDGRGSRVAVAIIKIPAKVPVEDERYGGAILLNPGGPGGSGVSFAHHEGEKIQSVVDATVDPPLSTSFNPEDKYFDIISFDPRGVNNTTPQLICFPNYEARVAWDRGVRGEGLMTSSDAAFATMWARFKALGGSCTTRMKNVEDGKDNLLEHVNTAAVVGDMVSIIEAVGEWRETEVLKTLDSPDWRRVGPTSVELRLGSQKLLKDLFASSTDKEAIIERTRWRKGEEKIQYWGFSYGTALGATFSAMQPHRVARVILDGVVDGDDYYTAEFKSNLNDTEAVWDGFFHYCALGGPDKCSFAAASDTRSSLRQKFDVLLSELIKQPIAIFPSANSSSAPDVVTASDLVYFIQRRTYTPLKDWPLLADVLRDLANGDGTSLSQSIEISSLPSPSCTKCESPYTPTCQFPVLGDDPIMTGAIWCSDAGNLHISPQEFKNQTLKQLEDQSPLFGARWAEIRMQCVGWDVEAKWRFQGPFRNVVTAHPVLWIGTTGDHVCPMGNAYRMSTKFPGSAVLQQDSLGHCSLSSPSICTARHVRKYFQAGKLPETGTICGVEQLPFEDAKSTHQLDLQGEDARLWNTVKDSVRFEGLI